MELKKIQEECHKPVNLKECHKALEHLINNEHSLHVPPEITDEDIVIGRALRELEEYRKRDASNAKLRGKTPTCWACGDHMEEKVEDIWTCPFCESIFTLGMSMELIEEKMTKEIRARERGMISGHGGGDKGGKKDKKKRPITYPRVDINPFLKR